MKKHKGKEPPNSFYTELCGKKYEDIEFSICKNDGKVSGVTKKLSDFVEDGTKRAWAIVFFTTWCPWSPPSINDMKKYAEGKDIMLIGLCVNEDCEQMKLFLSKHKKYLFNGFKVVGYANKDFETYRVKHVPHIVMLNKRKEVIRNYVIELKKDDPDSYDIEKIFNEALQ